MAAFSHFRRMRDKPCTSVVEGFRSFSVYWLSFSPQTAKPKTINPKPYYKPFVHPRPAGQEGGEEGERRKEGKAQEAKEASWHDIDFLGVCSGCRRFGGLGEGSVFSVQGLRV